MEEVKKNSWKDNLTFYIQIIVIVVALSIVGVSAVKNRGWEKSNDCLRHNFYDKVSEENGRSCSLDKCEEYPNHKENAKVWKCLCPNNNKTVFMICDQRYNLDVYHYDLKEAQP